MRHIRKSFGHAWDGLVHAIRTEHNLQLFLPTYVLVLIFGGFVGLLEWEWLALLISGTAFVTIELLNTSLERLTDIVDDQRKTGNGQRYHSTIKAVKDVAAAGSLASLCSTVLVTIVVFLPYLRLYIS